MKKTKLPQIDSIQELAEFWDTHDLTDFKDDLEEATELVFSRDNAVQVPLKRQEAEAIDRMARAQGIPREELVRNWVLQELAREGSA